MKANPIIPLPVRGGTAPEPQLSESGFDYASYERRAQARFRRASVCAWITTAVEALVTAAIGICIILSTLPFFHILS